MGVVVAVVAVFVVGGGVLLAVGMAGNPSFKSSNPPTIHDEDELADQKMHMSAVALASASSVGRGQ